MNAHTRACTHVRTFGSIEAFSYKVDSKTFSGSTRLKPWRTGATAPQTINSLYSLADFISLGTWLKQSATGQERKCVCRVCNVFYPAFNKCAFFPNRILCLIGWIIRIIFILAWSCDNMQPWSEMNITLSDFMHSLHWHWLLITPGTMTKTENVHFTSISILISQKYLSTVLILVWFVDFSAQWDMIMHSCTVSSCLN